MVHQTRRKRKTQKGGFFTEANKTRIQGSLKSEATKKQAIHCLTQLKRFAPCLYTTPLRAYQFFYNLGRLQELLGETTHPEIWWKPLEALVERKADVTPHIDTLKTLIGVEYDEELLKKGC